MSTLAFCRVGSCFMVLPGLASPRVPPRLRLFLALAASLAVAPLISAALSPLLAGLEQGALLLYMMAEIAVGLAFGVTVRVFFLALHFAAMLVANTIGLASAMSPAIDQDEQSSPVADIVMLVCLVGFFAAGQHVEVVASLIASFAALPPGQPFGPEFGLGELSRAAVAAFRLALEIGAPFVIYAFVSNTLLGLANRWVPQIPMQFVAAPILLIGGLAIIYVLVGLLSERFVAALGVWLSKA